MKTTNKMSKFVLGSVVGAALGALVLLKLDKGAIVVLAGLGLAAAYTYVLTHQSSNRRLGKLSRSGSPSSVLSVLVIGVVSVAGAYYLNASFAWHPQGKITKTVQNITTNSAIIEANSATAAMPAKPGDILVYTVTLTNIAEPAPKQYNDMAYTVLKDNLPVGVELVGNPTIRAIQENIGVILPGKFVVKTYQVKVVSTTNGAVLENKACFTADSVVRDRPLSGCDVAIAKVSVPVTPPTPTPPTPTPPTPTPPTPTPPTPTPPTPTPPTPTPPTPTPPTPTPPTPTPPTPTPPTPTPPTPTPTPEPPILSTTPLELEPPKKLPNVGPGNIAFIAAFALIGGYIFHELYWHIKGNGQTKRKTAR